MQQVELGTKERIHQIVDELEQGEAEWLLEVLEEHMADPIRRKAYNVPWEDEEITPEEEAVVTESLEQIRRGETVPWYVVRREVRGE
jgi:hypothetical protein